MYPRCYFMAITPDGYNENNEPCGKKLNFILFIIRIWGTGFEMINGNSAYTRSFPTITKKDIINYLNAPVVEHENGTHHITRIRLFTFFSLLFLILVAISMFIVGLIVCALK